MVLNSNPTLVVLIVGGGRDTLAPLLPQALNLPMALQGPHALSFKRLTKFVAPNVLTQVLLMNALQDHAKEGFVVAKKDRRRLMMESRVMTDMGNAMNAIEMVLARLAQSGLHFLNGATHMNVSSVK